MVNKAISHFGYTRPREAFESLPEPVARCAERMGWRDLCLSEEQDVIRGQFRKAYETQMNRERQDALVPVSVRENIARLTGTMEARTLKEGPA